MGVEWDDPAVSIPEGAATEWLAAVVDGEGRPVATVVLLDHIEGIVPEAVLDASGGCELRFPEGFTKRAAVLQRARGMALVNTGGETGPRQPPLDARPQSTLAGPCVIRRFDGSFAIENLTGTFMAGGAFVEVAISPDQYYAGAAVLIDGRVVAVVQEQQRAGVLTASLSELLAELRPVQQQQEPVQAASKVAPPPYAQQAPQPNAPAQPAEPVILPFTNSVAAAYGLAVEIGSSRPSSLPPTDAGVLLLGLLVAGRGPLASERVPAALADLLDEKVAERLVDAFSAVSSSADPATVEAAPVNPPQPFAGSEDVVEAAEETARAAGAPAVAMAHYAPAVVMAEIEPDVLAALGVTADQLRACVDQALAQPVEAVLAGPFASDQLHLSKDEAPGDELGTRVYATMLATLIAKSGTPMPLSIGLFGEWGSGKSYFMELLRREVDDLSRKGPPYLTDIEQLTFNAWHYSDTNLWASLGAEFFEQLLGPQEDEGETRREQLRKDLAGNQQLAKELTSAQEAAVEKAGELRKQLEKATQQREAKAQEWDAAVMAKVVADKDVMAKLEPVRKKLGLGGNVQAVVGLAKEVDGLRGDVAAIGQVLLHRRWRWTLVAGLVAATAAAGAVVASDQMAEWLGGGSMVAFTTALATVGRAVSTARGAIGPLREAAAKARTLEEQMRAQPDAKEKQLAEDLRKQEAEADVLSAQLADTVARAAEINRELGELHPGRRLYRFIADRVSSADYKGQLGIVSTVRHDFEELSRLMKKTWPEKEGSPKPIDRIVLYIDDLDRCEPHQVVAVLQAVHLLMAMDLFVVVVGVDPRWLLRSLRRQYRGVLGGTAGVDGFWSSTPQNYLEKIFQVPFVLPGMGQAGFDALLRALARNKAPSAPQAVGDAGAPPAPAGGHASAGPDPGAIGGTPSVQPIDKEADSELDRLATAAAGQPAGSPLPPPAAPAEQDLIEDELRFLAHLAELVATPRAAKRLFNIYALLRTTRSVWPGSSFLGSEESPGEFEAVGQLLAIMASRPDLLGILMWGRRSDGSVEQRALCRRPAEGTTWGTFIDSLEPRDTATGEWENDVADALTPDEATAWRDLVKELKEVQRHVTLTALEPYRQWAPKIARFSFVLSPFADDEPDEPGNPAPAPNVA